MVTSAKITPAMNDALLVAWDILRRQAGELTADLGLTIRPLSLAAIKSLSADVDRAVGEHGPVTQRWVKEHYAELQAAYTLPRLRWIEDFIDAYWDSEGIPRIVKNIRWWDYLAAFLGPRPVDLPDYISWRAALHQFYLKANTKAREELCRAFFEERPEAGLAMQKYQEPVGYDEIEPQVEYRTLYAWWWNHLGKKARERRDAELQAKRKGG